MSRRLRLSSRRICRATEIDVRLGAAWIPPADMEDFARNCSAPTGIEVSHSHAIGTWVVSGDYCASAPLPTPPNGGQTATPRST